MSPQTCEGGPQFYAIVLQNAPLPARGLRAPCKVRKGHSSEFWFDDSNGDVKPKWRNLRERHARTQEWTSTQPLKNTSLATMKSTNYLLNALVGECCLVQNSLSRKRLLCTTTSRRRLAPFSVFSAAMEAEDRGGSHGIQVDEGKIAEGAVCNVGCAVGAHFRLPHPSRQRFASSASTATQCDKLTCGLPAVGSS